MDYGPCCVCAVSLLSDMSLYLPSLLSDYLMFVTTGAAWEPADKQANTGGYSAGRADPTTQGLYLISRNSARAG